MKVTLHGAASDVTGSAYQIQTDEANLLVDCGFFQGMKRPDEVNVVPRGVNLRRVDAVLVAHAHLDHTGRLPLLVKKGFRGKILGDRIAARARVHTLGGFSAHAGQTHLLNWLGAMAPSSPRVILTHGEARARQALAERIRERYQIVPELPEQGAVLEI